VRRGPSVGNLRNARGLYVGTLNNVREDHLL
jgi:hypothetical protein